MSQMTKYSVRYVADGEVIRIFFEMPGYTSIGEIVTHGAGLLFLHDCCPGTVFCVYMNDDRKLPVWVERTNFGQGTYRERPHDCYRDQDDLWPADESAILDF